MNKASRCCRQLRCHCGKRDYPRRWVVDFRPLNAKTPQVAYPRPIISELINVAAGDDCYIMFDIDSVFPLIPVATEDCRKLAFLSATKGLLEWNVMPFQGQEWTCHFSEVFGFCVGARSSLLPGVH